jgi:CRP-like cAMP-binding protein
MAAGDVIVREGDHGDRFYVIDTGAVAVTRDGDHRRVEAAGEFFGEIALLRDVPRTATVAATQAGSLLALERADFLAAVTGLRRSEEAAGRVVRDRLGPR